MTDRFSPATALTQGIHHLGLTVGNVEQCAAFFTSVLGFSEIRRVPEYPAIFVSDGSVMLTLWQATEPVQDYDRKHNIGLHHVALNVETLGKLNNLRDMLVSTADVSIEFAPELLRDGPATHMMCHVPGGIRVEFIWPGT